MNNPENNLDELASAIKNGLERGTPIEKIKQSFINAGYNSYEIEKAAQKIQSPSQIPEKISILKPAKLVPHPIPETPKQIPQKQSTQIQKPKSSNLWIIILIITSILILIGSAILGLYWDKIF